MNWKLINHPLGIPASTGIPVKKEWIASAISGAVGLATSLFGGAASRRAAAEAEREQRAEKARLEGERLKAKYQSWMDTASGQNTMRILQDQARKFVRQQQGAAAVAGGTDAAVAMEKELQNQKQAEVIAAANANHEDRKDMVDAGYRQELARVNNNIQQSKMAQAEADAQVAAGVSDALMSAGQAMDEAGVFKGKAATTPTVNKQAGKVSPASGGGNPITNPVKPVMFEHQGTSYPGNWDSFKNKLAKSLQQNSKNYDTLLGKINDPMKHLLR